MEGQFCTRDIIQEKLCHQYRKCGNPPAATVTCPYVCKHKRTVPITKAGANTDHFLQNAFSERLCSFGFNLYLMFIVDLMHEFELGVWRALFIHLLRILQVADKNLVHELDHRSVIYNS